MGMANLQVHMQQMSLSTVNFRIQALGSQDEPLEKPSMQVAKTETLLQSHSALQDTLRGLAKGTLANSVTTVYDSDTGNITSKGKSADSQTVGTDSDMIGAPVEISDGEGLTPLFLAACFNDWNKCVKVLLEHGADINARAPEGHTPLMAATANGMLNNSEVLLAYDPDIDIRDVEGWTALSSFMFWNMHESIRLLVLRGASPETVTDEGDTLLHVAARYGDLETLRILMAAPMSMQSDMVNTFGETALDVAKRCDNVTLEWYSVFQGS
jgi:ankyrin repeat protein